MKSVWQFSDYLDEIHPDFALSPNRLTPGAAVPPGDQVRNELGNFARILGPARKAA